MVYKDKAFSKRRESTDKDDPSNISHQFVPIFITEAKMYKWLVRTLEAIAVLILIYADNDLYRYIKIACNYSSILVLDILRKGASHW